MCTFLSIILSIIYKYGLWKRYLGEIFPHVTLHAGIEFMRINLDVFTEIL